MVEFLCFITWMYYNNKKVSYEFQEQKIKFYNRFKERNKNLAICKHITYNGNYGNVIIKK